MSTTTNANTVCVYAGEALARYSFGHGHPFGPDRLDAFWQRLVELGLDSQVRVRAPVQAERAAVERFHTPAYVEQVLRQSKTGRGCLDAGDTPAFPGIYEAALTVVGSTLDALHQLMEGSCSKAFVPIAGLHHARRDGAAGFCVFNDCGVVIETLRRVYGVRRVAYVDIDAHHGDGVFYGFEEDPDLLFVDLHEDGRYLYPGTGAATETGRARAKGTKLNIPLPPEADDRLVERIWPQVEGFLNKGEPEFILFQCGADSISGDPITHLELSPATHARVARSLCRIAERHCQGRLLAVGGGGYNRENLATAWAGAVESLLQATGQTEPNRA